MSEQSSPKSKENENEEANINTQDVLLKNKCNEGENEEPVTKGKRVVFQERPIILNKVSEKVSESTCKSDSAECEKKDKKERNRSPTKVVVRRLPPTMTLESFIDNVSPLPDHDYIYFVRADLSLGPHAFSRVYINFINMDDLLTFYEQFDNYVFMDSKGNEYPAVVEFAPFQRVPKKRLGRKKDPKVGTLKDDPAFISFVASLKEKKDTSSVKQASAEHLLALTSENFPKKEISTPLLEFIKQRRAERQRIRDEKREERKRKELERKKIKDEERKRRKDNDSVLKVLRNPEHDDKEESGRNSRERDHSLQPIKKKEEERKLRDKERKEKRDLKSRDGGQKVYREERQKQGEVRVPRKVIDEQKRKLGAEENPISKSDTWNSAELDKDGKELDAHKLEKVYSRDLNLRKGPNDKYQNRPKDDRFSRDVEYKKNYRDDVKKSDKSVFVKDNDSKRGAPEFRKIMPNTRENDGKPKINDGKNTVKAKGGHDDTSESSKSPTSDECNGKKWELLGAKPKKAIKEDNVSKTKKEKVIKSNEEISKKGLNENLPESSVMKLGEFQKPVRVPIEAVKCDAVPGVLLKRRSSLERDVQHSRFFDRMCGKPRRQVSLDSDMFFNVVGCDPSYKNICISRSQEFEKNADASYLTRRNSLDCGDIKKQAMSYECFGLLDKAQMFKSDSFMHVSKKKPVISVSSTDIVKSEGIQNSNYRMKNEDDDDDNCQHFHEEGKFDKSKGEETKAEENKQSENSGSEGNKRDPRAERRIRNKDRPSIEIYRPGMGRFSMQRKEREKHGGVCSSTDQESPSNSPSPTPTSRLVNNPKSVRTNSELRSMTFKRS